MSFSLYYAPPEVVVAYKEKRRTILADPSADVWALGVRPLRLPCTARRGSALLHASHAFCSTRFRGGSTHSRGGSLHCRDVPAGQGGEPTRLASILRSPSVST